MEVLSPAINIATWQGKIRCSTCVHSISEGKVTRAFNPYGTTHHAKIVDGGVCQGVDREYDDERAKMLKSEYTSGRRY